MPGPRDPAFVDGFECDAADLETIRRSLSTTIVDHVLATGTGLFLNPLGDARFTEASSVRANDIRQVIVVPIGVDPVGGVVYLQARSSSSFTPSIKTSVEHLARELAPILSMLVGDPLPLQSVMDEQLGRYLRATLVRHDWNVSAAARDLGIDRRRLHELIKRYGLRA